MKLWLLSSETPHFVAGGIARYADNFARAFGAAGHKVTLISRDSQEQDEVISPGYRLKTFVPAYDRLAEEAPPGSEPDEHPGWPYNSLDYWTAHGYQMAEVVGQMAEVEGPPDVIECQEYAGIGYYVKQRQLLDPTYLPGVPVVIHLHSPSMTLQRWNEAPQGIFPAWWHHRMEQATFMAAEGHLAPSQFLAREGEEILGDGKIEVTTIPYPWTPLRGGAEVPIVEGRVVYFGRIEPRKGVVPMLAACEALWQAGETFTVDLYGGDTHFAPRNRSLTDWLKHRYRHRIETGQVTFHGARPHAEVLEAIQSAAVICIPSLWENWANTCMESLSLGKVLVTTVHGGQAEMVGTSEKAGYLFSWDGLDEIGEGGQAEYPEDFAGRPCDYLIEPLTGVDSPFARQLLKALGLSESERREMGQAARARMADYSEPARVISQREAHFANLIEKAKSTQRKRFPFINAELRESHVKIPRNPEEIPGLVSLVVPYYNLGAYLGEALESVLASTYRPLEIVIVNDGSTDAQSIEALKHWETRLSGAAPGEATEDNVGVASGAAPEDALGVAPGKVSAEGVSLVVIRQANGGLARARNAGAEAARGEFILMLDADDALEATFVDRAVAVHRQYENVHFVYAWERWFGGLQKIWPTWPTELPYMLGHNMVPARALVRRATFLRFGRNDPRYRYNFEDYASWLNLVANGCGGVALPEPLLRYRIREDSLWQESPREQHLHLHDLLVEQHRELFERYGPELFQLQNANGTAQRWELPAWPNLEDERERYKEEIFKGLVDNKKRVQELNQRLADLIDERDAIWHEKERFWNELHAARTEAEELKRKLAGLESTRGKLGGIEATKGKDDQ